MTRVCGVILDLDGTLIDSNDAHARAWLEAMQQEGFDPGYEKVRRLIGMGGDLLIPQALQIDPHGEQGKAISARRKAIFKERYLPQLSPFAKVRDLVLRMQAGGLRLVVASASKREELEAMLRRAGVEDLLTETTSASDVDEPKPEPDVVLAALDKLGLPPEQVVMLGDTPYDIEAASKAGVGVIALRCGGWDDESLRGAKAIYWDAADLFTHFEASPLGGARH